MKKLSAAFVLMLAVCFSLMADGGIPIGGYQGCPDPNVQCECWDPNDPNSCHPDDPGAFRLNEEEESVVTKLGRSIIIFLVRQRL